ncbi:Eukaryotic translation initiation factor 4 gamma [Saguinus oedipus]|uniref:Eukaryotic translation initiation factor 4 gamma n=1 Tax=Saguinus oedipus TaxID=9490 RepID=A0ABQ9VAB6_SAGOE|nr:Eukaryotic translation initiation factor 4 gamma [Saguinus oedipus]
MPGSLARNETAKLMILKTLKPSFHSQPVKARPLIFPACSLNSQARKFSLTELFRKVRSILNKLTPQMFNQLMKQVSGLTVDTEERLKGVIDLVFEKAIDEPSFSVAYANMCRCLVTLKVPMADKPGNTVNFRKLLLNRCQKEFEKDKADDDVFEKKQKELEAASACSTIVLLTFPLKSEVQFLLLPLLFSFLSFTPTGNILQQALH